MKSIEEHFIDSMPADIAAMAIANTEDSLLELKSYKTPEAALRHAFTWCNSKQGNLFWSQVFDTLKAEGDFRDHRCHALRAKEGRMSDTPRTDEIRHNVADLAMFARKLERELNEATKLAENRLTAIKSGIKVTGRYKRELNEARREMGAMDKSLLDEDRAELELQLAEARRDKARLDWIEETGGRCGQYYNGFFAYPLVQKDKFDRGDTLREAIDAAMEAEGEA